MALQKPSITAPVDTLSSALQELYANDQYLEGLVATITAGFGPLVTAQIGTTTGTIADGGALTAEIARAQAAEVANATAIGAKAPLDSPQFTGTPTAPTATAGALTNQIATTAFTTSAVSVEQSRAQAAEQTLQTTLNGKANASDLLGVAQDTLTALNGKLNTNGDASGTSVTPSASGAANSLAKLLTVPPVISDGTAATLSPQAAIDLAATLGTSVELRGTVQALTSPLKLRPGVAVRGTQGGGVSGTGTIIDVYTYAAVGASVDGCIIDGQWNSVDPTDNSLAIQNYSQSGFSLTNCTIRNIRGSAVYLNGAARFKVNDNTFTNIGSIAIAINNNAPFDHYGKILRNEFNGVGGHYVLAVRASRLRIEGNRGIDPTVAGMTVNATGPASAKQFTWVSGPDFTNIRIGAFLVTNGGLEYSVVSKASNTSLIAAQNSGSDPGTVNGVAASSGVGDQFNLCSGVGNQILNNVCSGGATTAYLVWDDGTYINDNTDIKGNTSENAGNAGIVVGATTKNRNTVVENNTIINPGQNKGGSGAGYNVGVITEAGAVGTVIQGNAMIDNQATPTMTYGINLTTTADNATTIRNNSVRGAANEGVQNGVDSIALGPAWGSTATVTNVVYREDGISFTVTSSGTGQAASPYLTIYPRATATGQTPQLSLLMQDGQTSPYMFNGYPQGSTQTYETFGIVAFTPVAGRTYNFFAKF